MPPEMTRVAWNHPVAVLKPSVPVGPVPSPGFSLRTAWPDPSVIVRCQGSGSTPACSCPEETSPKAEAAGRMRRANASPAESPSPRRNPIPRRTSAAGDRGQDRHLVAVVHGGVEAVLEADVLT